MYIYIYIYIYIYMAAGAVFFHYITSAFNLCLRFVKNLSLNMLINPSKSPCLCIGSLCKQDCSCIFTSEDSPIP